MNVMTRTADSALRVLYPITMDGWRLAVWAGHANRFRKWKPQLVELIDPKKDYSKHYLLRDANLRTWILPPLWINVQQLDFALAEKYKQARGRLVLFQHGMQIISFEAFVTDASNDDGEDSSLVVQPLEIIDFKLDPS